MAVTTAQITALRGTALAIGRIYDGIDHDLGFDDIVDSKLGDDIEMSYETTGNLPSAGAVPTYVSQYLRDNAGKPKIGANPYGLLGPKITARTLNLEEATAYLWWFMGELKDTPDVAWTSYGVDLGAANVDMTAQGIFAQEAELAAEIIAASEAPGTNKERLWLAVICAAPFRLHGGLRPDYRRDVATKITAYLTTLVKDENFDLLEFVGDKGQWEQDKKYSKVIAGIDMFLVRFPLEDYSRLRLCTIGARYKDCAALVGIEYLRNLLNIKFVEIFLWVWTEGVANDMRKKLA